ncbi:MAG: hypothetical protein IT260_23055 [Saprospiraceae bacterium]|nr:hypothetical protein [Saprospiraceae bacterium]
MISLAGSGPCAAQEIPTHHLVVLHDSLFLTKAHIQNTHSAIKYRADTPYFYYFQETIHESFSGSAGLLLDGPFESFFKVDNRLYCQGAFAKGLKTGAWRYWHTNGQLQRQERWTNGRLHGSFREYNEDGTLSRKGRYQKGTLHGRVQTFADGQPKQSERYQKGKLQIKNQSRRFTLTFKRKKG